MTSGYRLVLARPGAARLLGTAVVARLPQGMTSLTVLLLVHGASGSYAAAGIAVGLGALLTAVSMPFQGRLIDRLGIKRVIGPVAVGQAAAYVLLGVLGSSHASPLLLVLSAGLVGALGSPIAPVVRATLRTMFDDHAQRESAFAVESVLQEIIWVSGPVVVTVLITLASADVATYVLGSICLFGTLAFLQSPSLGDGHREIDEHDQRLSPLRGVDLRWMLVPVALMGMGLGSMDVGIPSMALHLGSKPASGVLLALMSFGSMVGGLWYGTRRPRSAAGTRYAQMLCFNALFIVPYLFTHSIFEAGVCSFVAGLAIAPIFTCQYSVAGRIILPGTEHEAFSWILSALIAGAAAGSSLAGLMIDAIGVRGPFILSTCAATGAALVSIRFWGRFPGQVVGGATEAAEELAAV